MKRGYNWDLDIKLHSFGKSTSIDNKLKELLNPDNFTDKFLFLN